MWKNLEVVTMDVSANGYRFGGCLLGEFADVLVKMLLFQVFNRSTVIFVVESFRMTIIIVTGVSRISVLAEIITF